MSAEDLTPRQLREKIKALLGRHILDALDTDREVTVEERRKRPSAAQLNAALSYLKCTDPKLGMPTKEEIEEDRKEFDQRVSNLTYRLPVDELGPLPSDDQLAEQLADEARRSAIDTTK